MMNLFDRSRTNRRTIEALHADIVAAVRQPAFYDRYGVADTFEGRFEMLTLLAALVLRRLGQVEAPGPEIAQKLVDTLFAHLDPALREMGVGDLAVPKRMKKLAEAFLGRSAAYDAALRQGGTGLEEALGRNVLDGRQDDGRLARYAHAAVAQLESLSLDDMLRGSLRFPDPMRVA